MGGTMKNDGSAWQLAVVGKLWHLQGHADGQTAGPLQAQSRVAGLGEAVAEAP